MTQSRPIISVDFQNADENGRVRLITVGTLEDIAALGLELRDGLDVHLVDFELEADGRVVYSSDESIWVAEVDWREVIESAGEPEP